jgi:hypothetical protein
MNVNWPAKFLKVTIFSSVKCAVVPGDFDFVGDEVLGPRIRDRRIEDALGKRSLLGVEVIERGRLDYLAEISMTATV